MLTKHLQVHFLSSNQINISFLHNFLVFLEQHFALAQVLFHPHSFLSAKNLFPKAFQVSAWPLTSKFPLSPGPSHSHTVIRAHCHTVTRSHGHTIIRSHCHTVTLSHGQTVTQSHCHTVTRSHGQTVTLSHCHKVTRSHSHTVTRSNSHTVTQSHGHTVTLSDKHTATVTRSHVTRSHTVLACFFAIRMCVDGGNLCVSIRISVPIACFVAMRINVSACGMRVSQGP
jgi:hypothetical protein